MPSRSLILAPKAVLTACLLIAVPACQTMTPEAWASALRPEYSSPEETGRSFFAAWAAKESLNEYRCFAESMKAEYGAGADAYLLFRPELEKQIGWVGRFAYKLEPYESQQLENGNVLVWWARGSTVYLGLEMERQSFFEFHNALDPEHRAGGTLDEPIVNYLEFSGREVAIYVENSAVRTARAMDEISKFEIGTEWKIAGIYQPPADTDS